MFRFENPIALLLLIVPVLGWLLVWIFPTLRTKAPRLRYSDTGLLSDLPTSWRVQARALPDVVRLLAWGLLVIALARPQSGQQQEVIRGQGIDIVMALDISSSMEADDILPSRLEAAKRQIVRFVEGREFDRVGLVLFAADAFHYVPPTLDYDVLIERLNNVDLVTAYELENGTAIGTGIASAANMLRGSDATSRIIVLLTDGSNNRGGVSPLDAARAAAALGIRVYTIGMGSTTERRMANGGDADFDEATLQSIAEFTRGLYFRAEDNAGLQRTYEQIDALERSDVEQQVFVRWREQAPWLIALGLFLLIFERLLRQTVFRTIP